MHMAFNFSERRTRTATIWLVALVGIAACGSDPDSVSAPLPPDASPSSTSTPTSTPEAEPSPALEPALGHGADVAPLGPTARRLVDVAAADLIERFDLSGLSPDNPILVAVAEEVTWRDSALGCPMKDMQYLQVLTPGFRIVLEFDGATYTYHSGAGQDPFYCARPETPAPSTTPTPTSLD